MASNISRGLQGAIQGALQSNSFQQAGMPMSGMGASGNSVMQSYCACGSPATRMFLNPKGISYNMNEVTPCLALCSACDFRFTVMRAAGRVDEFVTEYEEKQDARRKADDEHQAQYRQVYQKELMRRMQQVQQAGQHYQQQQNVGLMNPGSSPATCTENVQKPEEHGKPWYKFW